MHMTDSANHARGHWWIAMLCVGLFAFGFRYYYVVHAEIYQPVNAPHVRGDAVDYYNYARNLSEHGVFSKARPGTSPIVGDSYRDPGYPIFLAAWMKAFGQWSGWYSAVLLSQALLGALTVVLMMWLGRTWMPLPWLTAAGLLMAVWPHSVVMCSYLLTETLVGFLVALGLLFLRIALDKRSPGWSAAGGLTLSLGALTNAVLLPLAPLLAVYLVLRRRITARMFAALLIGGLALTVPWGIRNSLIPPGPSSSQGRALENLVQGSWPSFQDAYAAAMKHDPTGEFILRVVEDETKLLQNDHVAGLERIGRRMQRDPWQYIRWYLGKPALFWGWNIRIGQGDVYVYATRQSPFESNLLYEAAKAVSRTLNPLLLILVLAGGLVATFTRRWNQHGVATVAVTALFATAVYCTLQAEPRYSIPFRGLEIMLAMFAVQRLYSWMKNLKRPPARSSLS